MIWFLIKTFKINWRKKKLKVKGVSEEERVKFGVPKKRV